jgi:hypothetical protein
LAPVSQVLANAALVRRADGGWGAISNTQCMLRVENNRILWWPFTWCYAGAGKYTEFYNGIRQWLSFKFDPRGILHIFL